MFEELRQAVSERDPVPARPRRLEFACVSDTGLQREHNEDNVLFFGTVMPREHQSLEGVLTGSAAADESVVVAVFDGMGGEPAGETASYVAAQRLAELAPSLEADEPNLQHAFRARQGTALLRINAPGQLQTLFYVGAQHIGIGARGSQTAHTVKLCTQLLFVRLPCNLKQSEI